MCLWYEEARTCVIALPQLRKAILDLLDPRLARQHVRATFPRLINELKRSRRFTDLLVAFFDCPLEFRAGFTEAG